MSSFQSSPRPDHQDDTPPLSQPVLEHHLHGIGLDSAIGGSDDLLRMVQQRRQQEEQEQQLPKAKTADDALRALLSALPSSSGQLKKASVPDIQQLNVDTLAQSLYPDEVKALLTFLSPADSDPHHDGNDGKSSSGGLFESGASSSQFNTAVSPVKCSPFATSQTSSPFPSMLPPTSLLEEANINWPSLSRRPRGMSDFCSRSVAPAAAIKSLSSSPNVQLFGLLPLNEGGGQVHPTHQTGASTVNQSPATSRAHHIASPTTATTSPFSNLIQSRIQQQQLFRQQYGLMKNLNRKNSWHPASSLSSPSGTDSPPPMFDQLGNAGAMSQTPDTTTSSAAGAVDPNKVDLYPYLPHQQLQQVASTNAQKRVERQLRFLGCTMNAGNPCDTVVWPNPDWTWVTRPEGRLKSLFRVEWGIGSVPNIPSRLGVNDSILSPRYATTTDLQSIWISLTVCDPELATHPSQQLPIDRTTGASRRSANSSSTSNSSTMPGTGPPYAHVPTLDFPFSIKFTSTSGAMVKFGILAGTSYSGPHTHLFRKAPWSPPKEFGRMMDLIGSPDTNEVKIVIEIYDILFPDNVIPIPKAPSVSHRNNNNPLGAAATLSPASSASALSPISPIDNNSNNTTSGVTSQQPQPRQRSISASSLAVGGSGGGSYTRGIPFTPFLTQRIQTSTSSTTPTRGVLSPPGRLMNTNDHPLPSMAPESQYNARLSGVLSGVSGGASPVNTDLSSVELVSDILATAAMHREQHEAVKLLRLALCLCQDGGDSSADRETSAPSSGTTFFDGIRRCIGMYLRRPQNAVAAFNLKSLLAEPLVEIAGAGYLSEEQKRFIEDALPTTRLRAETLL